MPLAFSRTAYLRGGSHPFAVQWAGFAVPDWTFSEPAQYMPSPLTDTVCCPGETANVNGVGRFIC